MFRRRRIGLVAVFGVAVVAFLVWSGDDDSDPRDRGGSTRADSASSDGSPPADVRRDSRRRTDRAGKAVDPDAPDEFQSDFDGLDGRRARKRSAEDEEARRSDATEASETSPVALYALRGARHDPSVSLVGFDPLGPRDLVAWRLKNGRFAIVARGRSDRDGSLHFPDLIAARDGLEIVVTPPDGAPGLPGASDPRRWAARDPLPPHATLLTSNAEGHRVRIDPREGSGTVLLADAYGVELARYPIAPSPVDATRAFDVALTAGESETQLLVSHEFSDGRASEWEWLTLPAVESGEDESDSESVR